MIYHLFQYLQKFDIPGQGLFTYLSFRAMLTSVTAMLISFFIGRRIISWLQRKQIGETIRDLGLEGQIQKKGTPTMGGIIIIISIVVPVLLFCDLTNVYAQLLLFTTLWCGTLGFADDYIKVFKHNKEGLHPKAKLLAQIILGLVIGMTVWLSDDIVVREKVPVRPGVANIVEKGDRGSLNVDSQTLVAEDTGWKMENVVKSTKTTIPFVKSHEFDYKSLSPFKGRWGWYCKWAIYVLMIVIVITACSNGTNLTDGMDGLAAGTSAIVGVVLGVLAWVGGNLVSSDYLNIMYIPGSGEIAVFMSAFVGALMGFLWYNSFPAQVFMGDTGSLTIGGIIGAYLFIAFAYVNTHPVWKKNLKEYHSWRKGVHPNTLYPFRRSVAVSRTVLRASDADAVMDFYSGKLGYRMVARLRDPDSEKQTILLQLGRSQAEFRCDPSVPVPEGQVLSFSTSKIPSILKRLRMNGIEVRTDYEDPCSDRRALLFEGPDRVQVMILEEI